MHLNSVSPTTFFKRFLMGQEDFFFKMLLQVLLKLIKFLLIYVFSCELVWDYMKKIMIILKSMKKYNFFVNLWWTSLLIVSFVFIDLKYYILRVSKDILKNTESALPYSIRECSMTAVVLLDSTTWQYQKYKVATVVISASKIW